MKYRTLITFGFVASAVHAQTTLRGVGDLPGGADLSEVFALSADGSTAVGHSDVGGSLFVRFYAATAWTESSQLVAILDGMEAGMTATAYGVSTNGQTIVGAADYGLFSPFGRPAFYRDGESGAVIEFGDLPGGVSGVPTATARGVSGDGRFVVGIGQSDNGTEAFEYDIATAQFTPLGDLAGGDFASYAYGISNDASVIFGVVTGPAGERQAALWGPTRQLQPLGWMPTAAGVVRFSTAEAASTDGSVIVGASRSLNSPNGGEAYRWTVEEGMQGLGDLPGGHFQSIAYGVSGDGRVVVGRANIEGVPGPFGGGSAPRAFIWTQQTGMRDLQVVLQTEHGVDLGDWTLEEARGISADGRAIAGNGRHADTGVVEGWVVRFDVACPAGIDGDGAVGLQDLALLLSNFGQFASTGDLDADGDVDLQDLANLLSAFGATC